MARAVPSQSTEKVQSLAYSRRGFEPPRGWCSEVVWGFLLPNYLLLRGDGNIGHATENDFLFSAVCRRRILYYLVFYCYYLLFYYHKPLVANVVNRPALRGTGLQGAQRVHGPSLK